jgi:hypothetical protein
MTIEQTKAAVEGYTQGWIGKDLATARTWLADDLDFQGAIDRFDRADPLIEAIRGLLPAITHVDRLVSMYEDSKAFLLYDFGTATPAGTIRCAEYFEVERGKIQRMRLVFDATKLRALMPSRS